MALPSRAPATDDRRAPVPARVWSATAWLTAGRMGGALATLALWGLLARALEPAAFGRWSFYLVVLAFLDAWADCGTSSAVLSRAARGPADLAAALDAARRVRTRAALSGALALFALTTLAGEPERGWLLLASLAPLARRWEASALVLQDRIRWGLPVAVRAGTALLRLGAALSLLSAGVDGFGPFVAAHAAAGALGNLVLHRLARPWLPSCAVRPAPAGDPARWRPRSTPRLWSAAWPLALVALAQQAYVHVDNLVLYRLVGSVELGHYNAAVRVFSLAVLVAGFATGAALPWMARRAGEGALGAAALGLARPLLVVGLAVALAIGARAEDLLRLLFGAPFVDAGPSLRWLALGAVAVHGGSVALTGVVASGRSRAVLALVLSGLGLNLAGNLLLVPLLGIEGAAIATLATELWVALAATAVLVAGKRPAPGPGHRPCAGDPAGSPS